MATMATSLSARVLARNVKFSPRNLSLRLISTSKKNRETATITDALEKSEAKAEVKVKKVCFQTFYAFIMFYRNFLQFTCCNIHLTSLYLLNKVCNDVENNHRISWNSSLFRTGSPMDLITTMKERTDSSCTQQCLVESLSSLFLEPSTYLTILTGGVYNYSTTYNNRLNYFTMINDYNM